MSGLALGLGVAGSVGGTILTAKSQQAAGKAARKLAEQRAAIDEADAEAVERETREAVLLEQERGRQLLKTQKSQFAAANVRVDVGSPLVVAAQTRANLLKDVGFIFERGETERRRFLSQAEIERQIGKLAYRQSQWQSAATLGQGLGSLGLTLASY